MTSLIYFSAMVGFSLEMFYIFGYIIGYSHLKYMVSDEQLYSRIHTTLGRLGMNKNTLIRLFREEMYRVTIKQIINCGIFAVFFMTVLVLS